MTQITECLADPACRLLTLTGPGGIGKTRLATQSAGRQADSFADGVWFLPLAMVESARSLEPAIAASLHLLSSGPEDPGELVIRFLRDKHLLLIVDNLEHLLQGLGFVSYILSSAPDVKILATSRERLNLQEEWTFPIEGLQYPQKQASAPVESYSAVQLFEQRARQVVARFSLAANADAVVKICQYVEGMPLGIELAATWLRVMPCQQIAGQMEQSLDFLATPLRNISQRHRSMRSVFDHSWNLLPGTEQQAFAALSVFRGGFDLETAWRVAGASLEVIASLVDKSLVRMYPSGRYDLQELARQFACEKLVESGQCEAIQRGHLEYFTNLAEQAEKLVYSSYQEEWFDRLEVEQDNLRAALGWTLKNKEACGGLRLAGALGFYWELRRHMFEGYAWAERLLDIPTKAPQPARAKVLMTAGAFARYLGYYTRARDLCEESLALARAAGDRWQTAWALGTMGLYVHFPFDVQQAEVLFVESLTIFRELGDRWGTNRMLRRVGWALSAQEDHERAKVLFEESLAMAYEVEDRNAIAYCLFFLGNVTWLQEHDPEGALGFYRKSLALSKEIHDNSHTASVLAMLGQVARAQGDARRAEAYFKESLTLFREWKGLEAVAAHSLAGLAGVAVEQGLLDRAARLLAVVGAAWRNVDHPPYGPRAGFEQDVAVVRAKLPAGVFARYWAEGQATTFDQAVEWVLKESGQGEETRSGSAETIRAHMEINASLAEPLSERELEVLRLLTYGFSNAEIAQKMYVSVGTIKTHLRHIYGKLSVSSRTMAIAQAQKYNLL